MTHRSAGRIIRTLRPRRKLRTTPEGKWFLLLTVGVGVAAMNTGNNLLYVVLSMNLALIIVSGILSEWCVRNVAVRIRHASEAFARRESLLAVTCSAAGKRFPALSLSVSLDLPGIPGKILFPDLSPGSEAARVVRFVPGRRGTVFPVRCAVSTPFPFGLFEKSADLDVPDRLVVYPAPEAGSEPPASDPSLASGDRASRPGRQGSLIRGVRKHMPADPLRDIHWKASARLGRWMVKEREEESMAVRTVQVPDPSSPGIERELSRACARVLACEREGRPYRLYIGDRLCADVSDAGRRTRALTALALVPGGERP